MRVLTIFLFLMGTEVAGAMPNGSRCWGLLNPRPSPKTIADVSFQFRRSQNARFHRDGWKALDRLDVDPMQKFVFFTNTLNDLSYASSFTDEFWLRLAMFRTLPPAQLALLFIVRINSTSEMPARIKSPFDPIVNDVLFTRWATDRLASKNTIHWKNAVRFYRPLAQTLDRSTESEPKANRLRFVLMKEALNTEGFFPTIYRKWLSQAQGSDAFANLVFESHPFFLALPRSEQLQLWKGGASSLIASLGIGPLLKPYRESEIEELLSLAVAGLSRKTIPEDLDFPAHLSPEYKRRIFAKIPKDALLFSSSAKTAHDLRRVFSPDELYAWLEPRVRWGTNFLTLGDRMAWGEAIKEFSIPRQVSLMLRAWSQSSVKPKTAMARHEVTF